MTRQYDLFFNGESLGRFPNWEAAALVAKHKGLGKWEGTHVFMLESGVQIRAVEGDDDNKDV